MAPWKCLDCGTWWSGLEHRCRPTEVGTGTEPQGWVIRPYQEPTGSGGTSAAPWCPICKGFHIPGAGPCTATWSLTHPLSGGTI